jgi:hypothetical protein
MHVAVTLGEEPEAVAVGHPAHASPAERSAAALADPRVVVERVDDAGLAGFRVEGHDPAVLEIL